MKRIVFELVAFTVAFLLLFSGVHSADKRIMEAKIDSIQKFYEPYYAMYDSMVHDWSPTRRAPYLYRIPGPDAETDDFVTFEHYMWAYGFPDTIIVKFTVNGKFQRYLEAERRGIIEDSYGNAISPAYVYSTYNGDNWTYDVRGHFVEFNADTEDNDTRDYVPEYNP